MRVLVLTTKEGSVFKPYKGDDVEPQFVRLDLSRRGLGRVWVEAVPTDAAYREWVDDVPYLPRALGWGEGAGVLWSDLTPDERDALVQARDAAR